MHKADDERFATRLRQLRKERGLTQRDFAVELTNFCNLKSGVTPTSVCLWEKGTRHPRLKTKIGIAEYFNVSLAYLSGNTYERGVFSPTEKDIQNDSHLKISSFDLWRYDGKPIYVVFPATAIEPMWGIYDAANDVICFTTKRLKNASKVNAEFYTKELSMYTSFYKIQNKSLKRCLSIDDIMNSQRVYIELNNPSEYICGMYNGFYTHNEDRTCLVDEKGHFLEYAWNGDTYIAYYEYETNI